MGISACLLGQAVRYDGRDKRDAFLVEVLGPYVEWVPVCPEVEVGMGVPREPISLVRLARSRTRLLGASGRDWSSAMDAFAARRLHGLRQKRLAGYILKAGSPSCGPGAVPVTSPSGERVGTAAGRFAAALLAKLPALPVADERGLATSAARDHFVERVHAYARLQRVWAGRPTSRRLAARLTAFHREHALLLLAHAAATPFAALLARAERLRPERLRTLYEAAFSFTMARPATRSGHLRVLAELGSTVVPSARAAVARAVRAYGSGTLTWLELAATIRASGAAHPGAALYLTPYPAPLLAQLRGAPP